MEVFINFYNKFSLLKGEETLLRRLRQAVPAPGDLEGASDSASADQTVQRRLSPRNR